MIPSYEYRARQPVTRGVSAVGRIKRIGLLLALLAAALGLGGCGYDASVEELFTLPRMAEGYTDLAQQLDGLLNQGYEYASPTGGRNIQSVQMVDLDGDGRQEALAFMRRSSDEKPLKIFVFRMENENYQPYCTIESSGTAVDSVYYQDLNGDGRRELVVGWRISTDVQTVAVYAVEREPVALMSSGYTRFMMQDLNGDGLPSLLVLRTSEEGLPVAEFYGWQDGQMGIAYRCTLSSTMAALSRGSLVSGRMDADTPAMFITGVDERGVAVTDILIFRPEVGLVNVALDGSSGVSAAIFPYRQLQPQDIDGDGCIEIPRPEDTWSADQTDGLVSWLRCVDDGQLAIAGQTYHSTSCGWYLTVPASWWAWNVEASTTGIQNENQFTMTINGDPVLSIYTITGENRETRGRMGARIVLRRQTATVYAAELYDAGVYYGMNEELLRKSFSLITGSWINGQGGTRYEESPGTGGRVQHPQLYRYQSPPCRLSGGGGRERGAGPGAPVPAQRRPRGPAGHHASWH